MEFREAIECVDIVSPDLFFKEKMVLADLLVRETNVARAAGVLEGQRSALTPENIDAVARDTFLVTQAIQNDKKIQAIKELRAVAKCGLKESKDSVERIWSEFSSPWSAYRTEEPPF